MKKLITKGFYIVSVITLFISAALSARAQQFSAMPIETGGLYSGMAKDASNNLYVIRVTAGTGGALGEVDKYINGAGSPTAIYTAFHEGDDLGPGGDLPWGIAVAGNGDVYVTTDFAQGSARGLIIKLASNNGTSGTVYTPTVFEQGSYYTSLAFDAANNLYTTQYDAVHSSYAVYKYPTNSGNGVAGTLLYDNLVQHAGYAYPTGLAVAANGNVFVADAFSNDPSITDGGHIYKLTAATAYTATTLSTGKYCTALAFDALGNLFSSENSGSGYQLVKYVTAAGTPSLVYTPLHTNGIYYPWGIAIFSNGRVFFNDGDDGTTGGSLNVLLSKNANLSNLTISSGALTPVFAAGTASYTASVPNAIASVTLTPSTSDANATVKVNGVSVPSGTPSPNLPLVAGPNSLHVVVTAQDGTVKTYTVTVTRALSSNANLASLTISSGTLTPAFATATTSYTATVSAATASVTFTPTTSDPTATVKVNGNATTSGSASPSVAVATGLNNIHIVVTAQDGTPRTYTVAVTRLSNNANLSNLSISNGSLAPAFISSTTSYTVSVSNAVASVTVTPVTSSNVATVKVNGVAVTSATPSQSLPLAVGPNTIHAVVLAQDGTQRTYTITVTRALSSNANLANIALSSGTLSPAFASATVSYSASVTFVTTSITLTPTTSDATATVKVNGVAVTSGTASQSIALAAGANTIHAVVLAQDGTQRTYTVTVTRLLNNANLAALTIYNSTLTPAFAPGTVSYTASVSNATTSVTVTPTTSDPNATVKVNGTPVTSGTPSQSIPLAIGPNAIHAVVAAADGTQRTYTITVTRPSNNANLSALTMSAGTLSPVFASGTAGYTVAVANAITSVTLTPTTSDANATVKVAGVAVVSGTASASQPIALGVNNIHAVVTAQDGTQRSYTVTITRMQPNISYGGPYTYTAGIAITPLTPAGTNTVAAPAFGSPVTISNIFSAPAEMAVDAQGNVYLADTYHNSIVKLPVGGGAPVTVDNSFNQPSGVAIDAAGNIYVADNGNNAIKKIPVGGGSPVTLGSGFLLPFDVAVDASGNVFVADTYNNAIKEIPGGSGTPITISTDFNRPTAIALDALGNIYVADLNDNSIKEIAAGSGTAVTIVSGLNLPYALRLDGSNNLYVTTVGDNLLQQIPAGGGTPVPLGTGFSHPQGVVVDAAGNIYVSNTFNNIVSKMTPVGGYYVSALPGGLSFSNVTGTFSGTPGISSPATNYTVTGYNANVAISGTVNIKIQQSANLSNLSLSNADIIPGFAPGTTSYTASVPNSDTSTMVTPVTSDAAATIKVNGATVVSGNLSANIHLNVGDNIIHTVVLAHDGITQRTYTVTVNRASPDLNSLYLPGSKQQTSLVSSLNSKIEANNILSPNGDGINDIWVVKNIAFYPNNSVTVYDRAGNVVFTKKGYVNDWNGTYRGGALAEGTYYYLVDLGNGSVSKGFITVLRNR